MLQNIVKKTSYRIRNIYSYIVHSTLYLYLFINILEYGV